jgi:hypothetical protein
VGGRSDGCGVAVGVECSLQGLEVMQGAGVGLHGRRGLAQSTNQAGVPARQATMLLGLRQTKWPTTKAV